MSHVRLTADVEPELRRRVKIAAVREDRSVSEWVANAIRRELEREERERDPFTRLSVPAFARDWHSDEDRVYDELDS